ncbi:MAG: hypothetical protein CBC42_00300 [Betaproteobacteria bacterium TMED82]|nr:MAG: hypothetical protein CBC42_00300 [Betaproteobacteria bacterium TMED82]|tara:strand:+ start:5320 stop:7305 length:1986 start_codon:yes stop_codon:yes gene_type:complete
MKKKFLKQFLTSFGAVFLAVAISTFLTSNLTFLKGFENAAKDIRVAALQQPEPQSEDIIIATINEETVGMFQYRSPIDREFIADLILELERKKVKAIGVDVLFDSPTEPKKDKYLKETLRKITVPLFISYTTTSSAVTEEQLEYLNEFVPEHQRAAANFATDPFDGSVRWIFAGETEGMPLSFPRKAAQLMGITTSKEQISIAWRPNPIDADTTAFKEFPSQAIPVLPDHWFKDKIVLIGAKLSLTDRHRTPLALVDDGDLGNMPGVIIHAHALSQYLENREPHQITLRGTILMCLLMGLVGMGIGLAKKGLTFSFACGTISIILLWTIGFYCFWHGLPIFALVAPTLTLAISLFAIELLIGKAERQQRKYVQGAFSRYIAPAVVNQLVENPEALSLKGKKQETTFIFSDLAGFTTLSESLTPEKLSDVLNEYLDGACKIIFKHGGTVDKFIGDAIMAFFNAPILQRDHIERAVKCALELNTYCLQFKIEKNRQQIPIGVTRIGVHTGPATVGNFGSQSRMDFTALGDTVNTAARTESVNKHFGTTLAATQEVVSGCKDLFFLPIGDIILKGKTIPVALYNPIGKKEFFEEYATRYIDCYEELKRENLILDKTNISSIEKISAAQKMLNLQSDFPNEALVNFHVERIKRGFITTDVVMETK